MPYSTEKKLCAMSKETILPSRDGSQTSSISSTNCEDSDSSESGAPLVLSGKNNKEESASDNYIEVKMCSVPKKSEAKIEQRKICCSEFLLYLTRFTYSFFSGAKSSPNKAFFCSIIDSVKLKQYME